MNGRAMFGLVLLAAGALLWSSTPHRVTWGHHHLGKHALAYGLLALGAIFLAVGARRA